MITYNQATLREFGDGQHLVAYVEVNHPGYKNISDRKITVNKVAYYNLKNKSKVVGYDFYFKFNSVRNKNLLRKSLEKSLNVKLER